MKDITLQQIEIFLTVAEELSVSEAAKNLFLNQSAVSRWIQRLEMSLDAQLFRRNNRGVELTAEGEFLYKELRPLYDKLHTTLQNIGNYEQSGGGVLRVGCLDSSEVIRVLKGLLVEADRQFPDRMIKISLCSYVELRDKLLCGDLDCIVVYALGFGDYLDVSTKKIKRLDTYIAVSARSDLASSVEAPVELLSGETLYLQYIAEMKDAETRAIETCRRVGFVPRAIRYEQCHFALELAVRNGRGISIGGENMLDHFASDIKLYHVSDTVGEQYVILAWRGSCESKALQDFIQLVPGITVDDSQVIS